MSSENKTTFTLKQNQLHKYFFKAIYGLGNLNSYEGIFNIKSSTYGQLSETLREYDLLHLLDNLAWFVTQLMPTKESSKMAQIGINNKNDFREIYTLLEFITQIETSKGENREYIDKVVIYTNKNNPFHIRYQYKLFKKIQDVIKSYLARHRDLQHDVREGNYALNFTGKGQSQKISNFIRKTYIKDLYCYLTENIPSDSEKVRFKKDKCKLIAKILYLGENYFLNKDHVRYEVFSNDFFWEYNLIRYISKEIDS